VSDVQPLPDRIWTVPNALSMLRLLGVPLLLWLVLGPHADGWALLVLAVSALTDYLDGKIARATGQLSSYGAILDPAADRAYIAAVVIALAIRDIIPWWLVFVLVGREVVMGIVLLLMRLRGLGALPVHFVGKAATFALLYALPLLFLGDGVGKLHDAAKALGWAFGWWGILLYWWGAMLYILQAQGLIRRAGRERRRLAAERAPRDDDSSAESSSAGGTAASAGKPAGSTQVKPPPGGAPDGTNR
jgi:cardiolipin synthase (CMP-forming)